MFWAGVTNSCSLIDLRMCLWIGCAEFECYDAWFRLDLFHPSWVLYIDDISAFETPEPNLLSSSFEMNGSLFLEKEERVDFVVDVG